MSVAKMSRKSGPRVREMPPRRAPTSGRERSPSRDSTSSRSYSVSEGAHQPPEAVRDADSSREPPCSRRSSAARRRTLSTCSRSLDAPGPRSAVLDVLGVVGLEALRPVHGALDGGDAERLADVTTAPVGVGVLGVVVVAQTTLHDLPHVAPVDAGACGVVRPLARGAENVLDAPLGSLAGKALGPAVTTRCGHALVSCGVVAGVLALLGRVLLDVGGTLVLVALGRVVARVGVVGPLGVLVVRGVGVVVTVGVTVAVAVGVLVPARLSGVGVDPSGHLGSLVRTRLLALTAGGLGGQDLNPLGEVTEGVHRLIVEVRPVTVDGVELLGGLGVQGVEVVGRESLNVLSAGELDVRGHGASSWFGSNDPVYEDDPCPSASGLSFDSDGSREMLRRYLIEPPPRRTRAASASRREP